MRKPQKEEQEPALFDILTAYNSLRRDECSDWSKYQKQSGSIANLKFYSNTVSWMQRAGAVTVKDFDAFLNTQKTGISKTSENNKRPEVLPLAVVQMIT